MGCLFSYKWLFALIGYVVIGSKGFFWGFVVGFFFDIVLTRSGAQTARRRRRTDAGGNYQKQERTWQPYVDVTLQEAYRTLGIPSNASDADVQQAYRRLALHYHPDRVAAQGEAVRQQAERKFQEITEARDIIMRARGH